MNAEKCLAGMTRRYAIVFALFILTSLYIYLHEDLTIPVNQPFSTFPVQVGEWKMYGESFMSDNVLAVLKATDYLARTYQNSTGERVTLYIGYHGGGEDGGEIHSPKHCLPGSGWHEASSDKLQMATPTAPLNLVKAVYQKAENKEMFLYWFQVKGATLDNEYALKLAEIKNSALHRRRDAAFIRISVPFSHDESGALRMGESFIKDFYPVIRSYLPQ